MFLNYKNNALSWHLYNVCGEIKKEEEKRNVCFLDILIDTSYSSLIFVGLYKTN